jgi:Rnl2 family RNA ligase
MSFIKYPSIENSYQHAFVGKVNQSALEGTLWIVQEKLHGANFSVAYDADCDKVFFNKRSGIIGEKEKFYNCQELYPDLTKKIMELVEQLKGKFKKCLTVYGELIGGRYPGRSKPNQKHIQKGVDYCDGIAFVAFDIRLDEDFMVATTAKTWLILAGFHVVPEIGIYDTLKEALAVSYEFKSKVPDMLGMPEHPGPNICEGVVIRPRETFYLPSGSRAILKQKNDHFKEVSKTPKSKAKADPKYPNIFVDEYINRPRFDNVRSKLSEDANIGEIGKAMSEDVLEDYLKDNPTEEKDELKAIRKQIAREVFPFVRKEIRKP